MRITDGESTAGASGQYSVAFTSIGDDDKKQTTLISIHIVFFQFLLLNIIF